MCGRVACTLAPAEICRTCRRTQSNGKWSQPRWKSAPDGRQYVPCYNAAPTTYLPVMVSKKHFEDVQLNSEASELEENEEASEFVIQPMRWGLIPPWHNGEIKSAGYNTTNARSDGMCSKNTYKRPLEKGRRCVVLVEGYFEWQVKSKQPYFIYSPQEVSVNAEELKEKLASETPDGAPAKKLLAMAGIFDIYHPKNGEPPLYSYSVITVDAHKNLAWLHHRMPAILTTEQEVEQWLDFGNIPLDEAVKLIRPVEAVKQHPVRTVVNNSRNNTPDCIKEIDLEKTPTKASSNFMAAWLGKSQKRKSEESSSTVEQQDKREPDVKKSK